MHKKPNVWYTWICIKIRSGIQSVYTVYLISPLSITMFVLTSNIWVTMIFRFIFSLKNMRWHCCHLWVCSFTYHLIHFESSYISFYISYHILKMLINRRFRDEIVKYARSIVVISILILISIIDGTPMKTVSGIDCK